MRTGRFLCVAFLTIACMGCQMVLVQRQIGTPVKENLSERLDGVWKYADDIFYVKADSNGVLNVAGVEWHNRKFVIRDTSCFVTKVGDWEYLNLPLPADSLGRRSFLFAPFIEDRDGNAITAFMPSEEFFKIAMIKKELDMDTTSSGVLEPIPVDEQARGFFGKRTIEIVRSSEAYILTRVHKGEIDVAWPTH